MDLNIMLWQLTATPRIAIYLSSMIVLFLGASSYPALAAQPPCLDCGPWHVLKETCPAPVVTKDDFKACLVKLDFIKADDPFFESQAKEEYIIPDEEIARRHFRIDPRTIKVFEYNGWNVDKDGKIYTAPYG